MGSGTPGDLARQYPWQVDHYIQRGGFNDPVLPTAQAFGTVPSTLGIFSFNSVFTAPPYPGVSPPAVRNESINLTVANTGGIYIGTIPQGAWIISVSFFVYTAFTGGAGQSIGVGYIRVPDDTAYPTAFTGVIGSINGSGAGTGPPAGLFGGEKPVVTAVAGDGYTTITSIGFQMGPGNGTTGSASQLASLQDINLYAFTAGAVTGTGATISAATAAAFTAGSAAVRVDFTGIPG